jgi:hypothetical protein
MSKEFIEERQEMQKVDESLQPTWRPWRFDPYVRSSTCYFLPLEAFRLRVRAAFFAEAERAAFGLEAAALPPFRPPLRAGSLFIGLPRPEPPGSLPPRSILLTVAHALRSASSPGTPRSW